MKQFLFFFLFIAPFISKSQTIKDSSFAQVDSRMRRAGIELTKYHKQFISGVAIQIAGVVVSVFGSSVNTTTVNETSSTGNSSLVIAGGLMALLGTIIEISSTSHINKAGIILSGNSLIIPLHK